MKFSKYALLLSLCISLSAYAEAPIKVNGKVIDPDLFETIVKLSVKKGIKDDAALRSVVKEELIVQEVLNQKALDLKIEKDPVIKMRLEQGRKSMLNELLIEKYLNEHPVTDADIQKEYQNQEVLLKDANQYNLKVIVLADKAKADEVQKKLNQGSDFADLAKTYSVDTSKNSGGDLGWVLPNQVIATVANVMKNLAKGSASIEPIQTQVGWHIIKVDGKRAFQIPSLEEQRQNLQSFLKQQRAREYVKSLRDAAEVK